MFTSSILQSGDNLSPGYLIWSSQCMHHHLNKLVWHELKLEYLQVTVGLQTWHCKTRSLQQELNATNLNWHSSEWTECLLSELVENSHVLQTVCSIHCTCHCRSEQVRCERWLGEWCHFSVSCTSQSSLGRCQFLNSSQSMDSSAKTKHLHMSVNRENQHVMCTEYRCTLSSTSSKLNKSRLKVEVHIWWVSKLSRSSKTCFYTSYNIQSYWVYHEGDVCLTIDSEALVFKSTRQKRYLTHDQSDRASKCMWASIRPYILTDVHIELTECLESALEHRNSASTRSRRKIVGEVLC